MSNCAVPQAVQPTSRPGRPVYHIMRHDCPPEGVTQGGWILHSSKIVLRHFPFMKVLEQKTGKGRWSADIVRVSVVVQFLDFSCQLRTAFDGRAMSITVSSGTNLYTDGH